MKGKVGIALIEVVVGLLEKIMVEADPLAPMEEREEALTMAMVIIAAAVHIEGKEQVLIMVVPPAQDSMVGEGTLNMPEAIATATA